MTAIIGWDVGGAHLKLARVESGEVREVRQIPCPLWLGIARLRQAIDEALRSLPGDAIHAVTMTGELADIFADRSSGVTAILGELRQLLAGEIAVYGIDGAFLSPEETLAAPERAASANWHAMARVAAARCDEGLLVDVGSTTTDLVPLRAGAVIATGLSDAERLASGELAYQGVVRTPIMAVTRDVFFAGARVGLMAEYFATMADVYRLTGDLPEHADQHATADGRGKSVAESRARLARMIGRDAASAADLAWEALARLLAGRQLALLQDAAEQVLSRTLLASEAPVLGAGVGRFVAEALAQRLGRPYLGFATLIGAADDVAGMAADCAPAVAVALLRGAAMAPSSMPRNRRTAAASSGAERAPVVRAERKPR